MHIVEILTLVVKSRNLWFWKSTLAQAHRVGCLFQSRGAVGKASISGAHDSYCRRFNPRFFFLFFVLVFYLNSLGTRRLGSIMLKNLAAPAWSAWRDGPPWKWDVPLGVPLRSVRTENCIDKLHQKLTTKKIAFLLVHSQQKVGGPMSLTKNFEIW